MNYMTFDDAKEKVREDWKFLFKPSADGKGIVCPVCGHGEGINGGKDGVTLNKKSDDPYGLKCFGCGHAGDSISFEMKATGKSFRDAVYSLAERDGITIIEGNSADMKGKPAPNQREKAKARKEETQPADYTEYFRLCHERVADPEASAYLKARGISQATIDKYNIGYDPKADPANAPGEISDSGKRFPCKRVIIPMGKSYYVGRRIDGKDEHKKMNPVGQTVVPFNLEALYTPEVQEVFITEGAFDALSVIEAGEEAVAINSANNAKNFIELLKARKPDVTMIICLDNDGAGQNGIKTLKEGLRQLDIDYIEANISGKYKDPNEHIVADRDGFFTAVKKIREKIEGASRPDNVSNYIKFIMPGELEKFKEGNDKKTGYSNLDEKAGGLYSGLYVIAAISSLGKTTFAAQMADQIAADGNDVIFFSMEQSRLELVSKSLARITAQKDIRTAVSSISIRKGYLPEQVLDAADDYTETVGERLSIVEGNFDCTVSYIGEYVSRYIKRTGCKPVVIIDYLQIIQGDPDKRQSTKELTDTNITELKRLSRDLNITVFVISSVNRANYLSPIDFESLKESGGIEFTADVVWGLQLQCLNDSVFDKKENIKEKRETVKAAKAADPRKIELVCLKNRYGISSFSCFFDYYPANDWIKPGAEDDWSQRKNGRKM